MYACMFVCVYDTCCVCVLSACDVLEMCIDLVDALACVFKLIYIRIYRHTYAHKRRTCLLAPESMQVIRVENATIQNSGRWIMFLTLHIYFSFVDIHIYIYIVLFYLSFFFFVYPMKLATATLLLSRSLVCIRHLFSYIYTYTCRCCCVCLGVYLSVSHFFWFLRFLLLFLIHSCCYCHSTRLLQSTMIYHFQSQFHFSFFFPSSFISSRKFFLYFELLLLFYYLDSYHIALQSIVASSHGFMMSRACIISHVARHLKVCNACKLTQSMDGYLH